MLTMNEQSLERVLGLAGETPQWSAWARFPALTPEQLPVDPDPESGDSSAGVPSTHYGGPGFWLQLLQWTFGE